MKNSTLIGFLLLCINFNVHGSQYGHESHIKFTDEVANSYETTYQGVLSLYDEHLMANPQDALAVAEKCHFIDSYTYAESDLLYFESLDDDLTQCEAQIKEFPENHPERLLYEVDILWGEEATEKYNEIYQAGLGEWTAAQKVRFFQWVENSQRWTGSYDAKIPHTAFEETNSSQFALGAAIYEQQSGNPERAIELLALQQANNTEDQVKLAQLYSDLGLADQANEALANLEKGEGLAVVELIKLKTSIDPDFVPSTEQMAEVKEGWLSEENLRDLFEHAIDAEKFKTAQIIYQQWNADDFWQDPFKHHKFNLYQASGQWHWDVQDFYALLTWLAVVVICFLMAFLVIAPVHYRGLYRRVHGKQPLESLTQWNLKHALFLGTMFSLVGTLLTIIYQYDGFYSLFFMDVEVPFSDESGLNAKLYFLDALIMVVMSLLIFKHGKALFKIKPKQFMKAMMVAVSVFVLFKVIIVAGMFVVKLSTLSAAYDQVQLTITDISENYGVLTTFLTIAFLTPVIEEYLFRGVLLNSFTKHISFGWANTIQAGVFSLIHDNPDHYVHHFLFGLIVGYFVKTQKHIYGAIMFHMINNALAVSVLVL